MSTHFSDFRTGTLEGPKTCIFWLKIDWFYKIEGKQIQMCIHRMNLGFKKKS